jgi:phosphoribosylformylglycinamidine synthase
MAENIKMVIMSMAKPRTLVLTGYGINCDLETEHAFELAGTLAEKVHINDIIREIKDLKNYQIFVLPGGFSYRDDIAAGKVLAINILANLDDELNEFVERGNLILGICNGAQVGVKYPLPGLDKNSQQIATLTYNDSGRFGDRWIYLQNMSDKCVFTQGIDIIELPVAHGEGKFYVRDRKILQDFYANDQVVFKYVDENGKAANGRYPINPNGSMDDIAGICDITGRIFIMMPHPERYLKPQMHPRWKRQQVEGRLPKKGQGLQIFRNAVNYFK